MVIIVSNKDRLQFYRIQQLLSNSRFVTGFQESSIFALFTNDMLRIPSAHYIILNVSFSTDKWRRYNSRMGT